MAVSHRLGAIFCLFALVSLTSACRKHSAASIPAPPPTPQRVPKARRTQPTASTPASSTMTQPAAAAPGSPAVEAPRLGQMLSSSEERQYNALIDQTLSQTQSNLNLLAKRSLTPDQQSSIRAIQEFMSQANATRTVDLVSAKALADKAQVLARDLVRNVK